MESKMLSLLNSDKNIDELIPILKNTYKLYVRVDDESNLILVKYIRNKSNFEEPIVNECRGIVMTRDKKVICFPPERSISIEKMIEYTENDLTNIRYEEHVDGTMINVFYNPIKERWEKATRSRIGANCTWLCKETFASLFKDASNDMDLSILDRELCYTFVLAHPKSRIIVRHKTPFICLVTVRKITQTGYENISLEETQSSLCEKGLAIKIPKVYNFVSIEDMKRFVSKQDSNNQGIIIKYKNFRAKMRNKEYEFLKDLKGNTPHLVELYLRLRKEMKVRPFLIHFSEYKKKFNAFREDIHQITYRIYNWYVNVYINKYCDRDEIPYEFKPHCTNLHNLYIEGIKNHRKERITLNKVISYVNNLPVYSIIYIRNHYIERINNSINS
tara:strand:- start:129 stop:1292 length:1164 start_codon:yes stop_codon:yes gene_type:complete